VDVPTCIRNYNHSMNTGRGDTGFVHDIKIKNGWNEA
jgi:hypothetical protein